MNNTPIDPAMIDRIGDGETILFIGAGFSLVPDGSDQAQRDRKGLKQLIIERYHGSLSDTPYDLARISVEELVSYLRARKNISKKILVKTLQEFLAESDELARLESFSLLRTLLTLRPNLFEAIITTNWDKGVETVLEGAPGVELKTFVRDEDCLDYDSSKISLLKIHGDIDDEESIVLSSQDFDTYEKSHPRISERLRILFTTKYVILLGYSASDGNFRRIFNSLCFDLEGRFRSGWLVSPALRDQESLWIDSVQMSHIEATAQDFLGHVISSLGKVSLGISNRIARKTLAASKNAVLFERLEELRELAVELKEKYGLFEVWIARLRSEGQPNVSIGRVAAYYLECRCRAVRSFAISTGQTMEALARHIDGSVFSRNVSIFSTMVLRSDETEHKDPAHVPELFVSRFPEGRARYFGLRLPGRIHLQTILPDEDRSLQDEYFDKMSQVGRAHVEAALRSEVLIASVRPFDWFGGGDDTRNRTAPFQSLLGKTTPRANETLAKLGVAAIHQMIPLDREGRDITVSETLEGRGPVPGLRERVIRPTVEELAERIRRDGLRNVLVAAHAKKVGAVEVILRAGISNVLVVDEDLARSLLERRRATEGSSA